MKTCKRNHSYDETAHRDCPGCKKIQYQKHKGEQRGRDLMRYWPGCNRLEAIEKYNALFEKQEGRCAICQIHQSELRKSLFVDHDHQTGAVRGLLCGKCNSMIGLAMENLHILQNAKNYLHENS